MSRSVRCHRMTVKVGRPCRILPFLQGQLCHTSFSRIENTLGEGDEWREPVLLNEKSVVRFHGLYS